MTVTSPQYLQMTREEAKARAAADGIAWVRVIDLDDDSRPNITKLHSATGSFASTTPIAKLFTVPSIDPFLVLVSAGPRSA
jgi:hypothetical protein